MSAPSLSLFLLFGIGADRYALPAHAIVAVLPLVPVKAIPGTPAWVAGLLAYRAKPVPVIDISALATGIPAAARTSTRTVVVDYRHPTTGQAHWLGLRLEHATGTLRCDSAEFADGGIDPAPSRFLGPVRSGPDGIVQRIDVPALLSDEVHARLFAAAESQ